MLSKDCPPFYKNHVVLQKNPHWQHISFKLINPLTPRGPFITPFLG
jgi:hypothetical protein